MPEGKRDSGGARKGRGMCFPVESSRLQDSPIHPVGWSFLREMGPVVNGDKLRQPIIFLHAGQSNPTIIPTPDEFPSSYPCKGHHPKVMYGFRFGSPENRIPGLNRVCSEVHIENRAVPLF